MALMGIQKIAVQMAGIQELLSPSRFIPHGHCYLWQKNLVGLHLLSDAFIAIAYFSIPIMLIYFIRKREDVPFRNIFLWFSLFIITCGTTHLMSIWTLWHPAYWLSGIVKATTAVVSVYTALTLLPIIPVALAMPSAEALRQINQQLEDQIEERKQAEAALQHQLKFDRLIAETSAQFIDLAPNKISPGIDKALQNIAQFMEVDTSYVFEINPETNTMSMTHEWVDAGYQAQIEYAKDLPLAAFPWAAQILLKGDVLKVPSVDSLPAEAAVEQKSWQQFQLRSLISVPLLSEGQLQGWVGFGSFSEDNVWVERSVQLLKVFAEMLNRALQRRQSAIELQQSKSRLQMALEAGKTSCWEQNLDSQEIQGFGWIADGSWEAKSWTIGITDSYFAIHPEDRDWVKQTVDEAIAAKSTFSIEHRLDASFNTSNSPSQERWVLAKGKVLAERDQPSRIAGLTVDITERKLAAAALKEVEDRWQLAIQATNDGIWDWNIEADELFVSPRLKQMLGYGDREFPNEISSWASRIHPADVDRVFAASLAHRQNKTPYYTAEYRLLHQEGRYIWVLDRAKALRNEAGEAIRMTGSISDIDARKQAEQALKQLNQELELRVEERTAAVKKSELRFRSLFESAPDFIYVLNEQGHIEQVNTTVLTKSGYTSSDMIAQPLTAFLSEKTQLICQSGFNSLLTDGYHRQEMEFICKDGRILIMDCSCTVVQNEQSENYILVLQRDITQRQKDEQERAELLATLQESERRWQSFLNNVQLLVVGLDPTGKVEYANPCCVARMSNSKNNSPSNNSLNKGRDNQLLGKNWFESFVPASQKERSHTAFKDILNGVSDHPNYQNGIITQSGEERLVSWNTTLLKDTQGNAAGTLSIGEDITERHAIDRMKSEFISVVSHELRTPLTAIHGALDLLSTGLIDPQSERGLHVLSLAVENSDRLVKLVNDILELERLESGKIKLHKTSVSTQELMQRLCDLLELVAERAGIVLNIPETDITLLADCDRLIQVLTNLVGNAIKFSDAPATIWIEVQETQLPAGRAIKFVVADEGRGIPQDKVKTIFERFHQVDASDSRSKGGTGLGLAICRSIVQQHNGDIWVESTLGEGSRFMFTIPVQ